MHVPSWKKYKDLEERVNKMPPQSLKELGQSYGVTVQRMHEVLHERGLYDAWKEYRRHYFDSAREMRQCLRRKAFCTLPGQSSKEEQYLRLVKEGKTVYEIAKTLGVTVRGAMSYLSKYPSLRVLYQELHQGYGRRTPEEIRAAGLRYRKQFSDLERLAGNGLTFAALGRHYKKQPSEMLRILRQSELYEQWKAARRKRPFRTK